MQREERIWGQRIPSREPPIDRLGHLASGLGGASEGVEAGGLKEAEVDEDARGGDMHAREVGEDREVGIAGGDEPHADALLGLRIRGGRFGFLAFGCHVLGAPFALVVCTFLCHG